MILLRMVLLLGVKRAYVDQEERLGVRVILTPVLAKEGLPSCPCGQRVAAKCYTAAMLPQWCLALTISVQTSSAG